MTEECNLCKCGSRNHPSHGHAQSASSSHGGACADPFAPPEALNGRNESERGAARRRRDGRTDDGRTSVARKARERGKTGFAQSVRQRRDGRRDDGARAVTGVSNLVKVRERRFCSSDLTIAIDIKLYYAIYYLAVLSLN